MDVWEIDNIHIRFKRNELYDVACALMTAIEKSAERHWVHHYEGDEEGFVDKVLKENPVRTQFIKMAFEVTQFYGFENLRYNLKQIWKNRQKGKVQSL